MPVPFAIHLALAASLLAPVFPAATPLKPALARVLALQATTLDATSYGAQGDGTTDDTSALQAALDAAGSQASAISPVTLVIPAGTYRVATSLTVPSHVRVQATGATLYGAGLNLNGAEDVTITDLAISHASYAALSMESCTNVTISNLTVDEFACAGDSSDYPGLLLQGASTDVRITGSVHAIKPTTTSPRAVRLSGSGYALDDFTIDYVHDGTYVVDLWDGATHNTLHTTSPIAVNCATDAAAQANDVRVDAVGSYPVYDKTKPWKSRFFTHLVLDVLRYNPALDAAQLSSMDVAPKDFTRTVTINAVWQSGSVGADAHLTSGGSEAGAIHWNPDRVIPRGSSEVVTLVAQADGTWQEVVTPSAAHTFATVADMVAHAADLAEGDTATTARFRAGGPTAGGGTYLVVRAGDDVPDANNDSVAPFHQEGTRHIRLGDTGLWAVLQVGADDTADLRQFGAWGDDAHDDSAALQAAVYAGPKELHVGPGTYLVDNVYADLSLVRGGTLNLVGDAKAACFIKGKPGRSSNMVGGGYTTLMSLWNSEHLTIKRLTFLGNTRESFFDHRLEGVTDKSAEHGPDDHFGTTHLALWHVRDARVEDCDIQDNWPEDPEVVDCGDVNAGIQVMGVDGLEVRRCGFYSLDCGFICMGTWDTKNVTVDSCDFDGHRVSEPVVFMMNPDDDVSEPAPVGENLTVTNNTIRNCELAQSIVFADGVRDDGLMLEGKTTLIAGDDWEHPAVRCTRYRNVHVEGNRMENMANSIRLHHVYGGVVKDNVAVNAGAMRVADCHGLLVENYVSRNALSAGVYVLWENSDVTFRGLVVDNYGLSGEETCALSLLDVAKDVKVESGYVRGGAENQPAVIFAGRTLEDNVLTKGPSVDVTAADPDAHANVTYAQGYDVSGLIIDRPARWQSVFCSYGANTYHTGQGAYWVVDGNKGLPIQDIRVDATAEMDVYEGLGQWWCRYHSSYLLWVSRYWAADGSGEHDRRAFSHMDACQAGFEREVTIAVLDASDAEAHLLSAAGTAVGDVVWEHADGFAQDGDDADVVPRGTIVRTKLTCDANGVWRERPGARETLARTYPSVAALKASGLTSGTVTTLAYYEHGPAAGGGTYDILPAASVTYENGTHAPDDGRYVRLDNGYVAVLRLADGRVDLRQYGAKGDGDETEDAPARTVTVSGKALSITYEREEGTGRMKPAADDTAALVTALRSGAKVHVSPGTYALDAIALGLDEVPGGSLTVEGDGSQSCVFKRRKKADDDLRNTPLLELWFQTDAQSLTFRDVGLCGNTRENYYESVSGDVGNPNPTDDYVGAHVAVWEGRHVTFERVTFRDNWPDAPVDSDPALCLNGSARDVFVRNCAFHDVDCGVIGNGTKTDAHDNTFENIRIVGNDFAGHAYSEPVSLMPFGGEHRDITVADNTIRDIANGCGTLIADGAEIDGITRGGEGHATFTNVTIAHNSYRSVANALLLNHAHDSVVDDVTARDAGAVKLGDCKGTRVSGLRLMDTTMGLLVRWDCEDVAVSDLRVVGFGKDYKSKQTPGQPAISLRDSGTGVTIAGYVYGARPRDAVVVDPGASGFDLTGLVFDVPNTHDARAVFVNDGVTGLRFRTAQNLLVHGMGAANDVVVDATAPVAYDATWDVLGAWFRYYATGYELVWDSPADRAFSSMVACPKGFVRAVHLTVPAGSPSGARLENGPEGERDSIVWERERVVVPGEDVWLYLACDEGGVWREVDVQTYDEAEKALAKGTLTLTTDVEDLREDDSDELFGGENDDSGKASPAESLGGRATGAGTPRTPHEPGTPRTPSTPRGPDAPPPDASQPEVPDPDVPQPGEAGAHDAPEGPTGGWSWDEASGWRFLGEDGAWTVGWLWDGTSWYHFSHDGALDSGWLWDAGEWYWLNPEHDGAFGAMATGWVWDAGWYWMNADPNLRMYGSMTRSSWVLDRGSWYVVGDDGAMLTGWSWFGNAWWYLGDDGALWTSAWTPDGLYVDGTGRWVR